MSSSRQELIVELAELREALEDALEEAADLQERLERFTSNLHGEGCRIRLRRHVADQLQCDAIGIELNPDYIDLAKRRSGASLETEPAAEVTNA